MPATSRSTTSWSAGRTTAPGRASDAPRRTSVHRGCRRPSPCRHSPMSLRGTASPQEPSFSTTEPHGVQLPPASRGAAGRSVPWAHPDQLGHMAQLAAQAPLDPLAGQGRPVHRVSPALWDLPARVVRRALLAPRGRRVRPETRERPERLEKPAPLGRRGRWGQLEGWGRTDLPVRLGQRGPPGRRVQRGRLEMSDLLVSGASLARAERPGPLAALGRPVSQGPGRRARWGRPGGPGGRGSLVRKVRLVTPAPRAPGVRAETPARRARPGSKARLGRGA